MQRNAVVLRLGSVLGIKGAESGIGLHQVVALLNEGLDHLVGNVIRQIRPRDQVRAKISAPGRTLLALEPFGELRGLETIFRELLQSLLRQVEEGDVGGERDLP